MEAAGKEEISVEDEAVDKNIFKDCSKIAFYSLFAGFHQRQHFQQRLQGRRDISEQVPLASSSKPQENGTVPNQPPPQQMRNNYHLLTRTVSAETARHRQLTWELDRLIVLGEQANAQHELASILHRESVLAINQLAATVEGALSALQQFSKLLNQSLNPGKY